MQQRPGRERCRRRPSPRPKKPVPRNTRQATSIERATKLIRAPAAMQEEDNKQARRLAEQASLMPGWPRQH